MSEELQRNEENDNLREDSESFRSDAEEATWEDFSSIGPDEHFTDLDDAGPDMEDLSSGEPLDESFFEFYGQDRSEEDGQIHHEM